MSEMKSNKPTILVVDDSEMNRSILADILEEYKIMEAANGKEAVSLLEKYGAEIDLVLLDIVMPEMDGFEVLAIMNKYKWIEYIPVIMISAESVSSYIERAYELGVTDYINRPFDSMVVHRRVVNTIMLYAKQKKLVGMVTDQIYEKEKSSSLMVMILSHIVEFRNGESGMHVLHIHVMTEMLLKRLTEKTKQYGLTHADISLITTASALHDIGKINIAQEILNKPGRLTDEEFQIMKTHSMIGATMLKELPSYQEEPLVKVAYEICRWHHERYDGRGYPDGLKGEEIPISAQVVAMADVYDALISERVYKKAFSHEKAMEMILNGECGTFNPLVLECLEDIGSDLQEELEVNSLYTNSKQEMRNVADELLRRDELTASERTLRLLEYERTKYQFFADMSQEIQFEFTAEPSMVNMSAWGAKSLGIDEISMTPFRNAKILNQFGKKNMLGFAECVKKTTPQEPVTQYECSLPLDGEYRWCRVIFRSMWTTDETETFTGVIGKIMDIHEERKKVSELEHKATHDNMTGLVNHVHAKELITQLLSGNPNRKFALVIFDLDHFKQANDNYGHYFGDQVLKHVAEKLNKSVRSTDISARIGGDEFLIFIEYDNNLEMIIDRIFHSLTGQFQKFKISLSMGIAQTEVCGRDYAHLFCCADKALYVVKNSGRGRYCTYDHSMQEQF